MDEPLVTLEDFASYLKRSLSACDAYTAQLLVGGATDLVREYCGWHIAPEISEQVTVDGTGTALQSLPTLNLVSLESVAENGLLLDVRHIDWSANGLMEKRRGNDWTSRRRGIIADITHGYESAPGWLLTLIFAVVGRAFVTPLGGVVQESAGGESITYRGAVGKSPEPGAIALVDMEMRMLDRLRIPASA